VNTTYKGNAIGSISVDPDSNPFNGNERTTRFFYDGSGNLIRGTDALDRSTTYGPYSAGNQLDTVTLPDGSTTDVTYDSDGNLSSLTPPGKAAHLLTHGPRGRIESYTPPSGETVVFKYDAGRRLSTVDFGSNAINGPVKVDFIHSASTGQLTGILSPSRTVSLGYTGGRLTSVVALTQTGSIATDIRYDGFLPISVSWEGTVATNVSWTYNERLLMQSETVGTASSASYAYDKDGLTTQAGALQIVRDLSSGRVTQKTVGNVRETIQYNGFAEVSKKTVDRLSAGSVIETIYDGVYDDGGVNGRRDRLGRVTKMTERIVDVDFAASSPRAFLFRTADYGYAAARPWLESVEINGVLAASYAYDENGNRTAVHQNFQWGKSGPVDLAIDEGATRYDAGDRILTYGSKTFSWNKFGQMESSLDTLADEQTFYEYDAFGNLLAVGLSDGRTIEYDVDGMGRRVGRHVFDVNGTEIEFRGWVYRDLLRPVAEVDAAGRVVARYVYSGGSGSRQNGISQLATRLGGNRNSALPFDGRNVPDLIEILGQDQLVVRRLKTVTDLSGSLIAVVDTLTGDIVQRLQYDEFGRVLFDSYPGFQPFGFGGGVYDSATRMTRFGARDYMNELGRWTTRDPLLFQDGENLYLAFAGDPVNSRDWTGLDSYYPYGPNAASDSAEEHFPGEGPGGGHNNAGDAYRHCVASCWMTQAFGADVAEALGNLNEGDLGGDGNDDTETAMDRYNNRCGQNLGEGDDEDCSLACYAAAMNGSLRTLP